MVTHECIKCHKNKTDMDFPLGIEGTFVCHGCINAFVSKYTTIRPKKAKGKTVTEIRKKLVAELGGKCAECGNTNQNVLQVDHIHGGGIKELKEKGRYWMYKDALQLAYDGTNDKYQLLCANCNWEKRHKNGEQPLPKVTKKLTSVVSYSDGQSEN